MQQLPSQEKLSNYFWCGKTVLLIAIQPVTADTDFAGRVQMMVSRVGSRRVLADVLGVSRTAVSKWLNLSGAPYDSTLSEICERTGIRLSWLRDGIGDTKQELRKLPGAQSPAMAAEMPPDKVLEEVRFILSNGTPDEIGMVQQMVRGAYQRVRTRKKPGVAT